MPADPPHMLIRDLPAHRQLYALTRAGDGSIISDKLRPNGELTVGDLWQIIREMERACQVIGEMALKN